MLHIRAHSVYSYGKGLAYVEDIVKESKRQGEASFCISDIDSCTSFIKANAYANKHKMKFIYGIDMQVEADEGHASGVVLGKLQKLKKEGSLKSTSKERYEEIIAEMDHLKQMKTVPSYVVTLLARNSNGLKNMMDLYSNCHIAEGEDSLHVTTVQSIIDSHDGLMVVLDDQSRLHTLAEIGADDAQMDEELLLWKEAFGEDLYVGLEQKSLKPVIDTALRNGVKIVATNMCMYVSKNDRMDWRIFRNAMSVDWITHFDDNQHMLEDDEWKRLLPEWASNLSNQALENLNEVDQKCEEIKFPKAKPLVDRSDELLELCKKGWERLRKGTDREQESLERYQYELSVINAKGFSEYFLKVLAIVNTAKKLNVICGPARGSGGGSEVCYLIGITKLDPLKFNLYFERFLNPGRPGFPDIDLDFSAVQLYSCDSEIETPIGTFKMDDVIHTISHGDITAWELYQLLKSGSSVEVA